MKVFCLHKTYLMISAFVLSSWYAGNGSARDAIDAEAQDNQQKPPYVYRTHRQPPPVHYEYRYPEPDIEYYVPLIDYRPRHHGQHKHQDKKHKPLKQPVAPVQ